MCHGKTLSKEGAGQQPQARKSLREQALQHLKLRVQYLRRLGFQCGLRPDEAEELDELMGKVGVPAAPGAQLEMPAHGAGHRPGRATKGQQTVTIFDWDDTLLCTTWLRKRSCDAEAMDDAKDGLRDVARLARQLLEAAMQAGLTVIVTNAQTGWVEHSASLWAPELLPVLRKVRIISARDGYERWYPMDEWKTQAFLKVQRELDQTAPANLVVLGDAQYEMEAAQAMAECFEEVFVKTVKFARAPALKDHLGELQLVAHRFASIVNGPRSMSILLEKRGSTAC